MVTLDWVSSQDSGFPQRQTFQGLGTVFGLSHAIIDALSSGFLRGWHVRTPCKEAVARAQQNFRSLPVQPPPRPVSDGNGFARPPVLSLTSAWCLHSCVVVLDCFSPHLFVDGRLWTPRRDRVFVPGDRPWYSLSLSLSLYLYLYLSLISICTIWNV